MQDPIKVKGGIDPTQKPEIDSIYDIDLALLSSCLPGTMIKMRAFLLDFTLKQGPDMSSPAVTLSKREGHIMFLNKPFIDKYIDNYYELAFTICHELVHLLCRHVDPKMTGVVYGIPEMLKYEDAKDFLESDESDEVKKKFKLSMYTDEMEVKALEELIMPDDVYHTLNAKLFSKKDEDDEDFEEEQPEAYRFFSRTTNLDDLEDKIFAVFGRAIREKNYSKRNAFNILKSMDHPMANQEERKVIQIIIQAMEDIGDESINTSSSSSDSATIEELSEKVKDDIKNGVLKIEASKKADDPGDKDSDKEDKSKDSGPPDIEEREDKGPPDMSLLTDFIRILDRNQRSSYNPSLSSKLSKYASIPSTNSMLTSALSRWIGGGVVRRSKPNFKSDKSARKKWALGHTPLKYNHKQKQVVSLASIYFDVSGSQDTYIPDCVQALLSNKSRIGKLFLFGTVCREAPINEFLRAAEKDRLMTGHGDFFNIMYHERGTVFNRVLESILDTKKEHVVIITDNESYCSPGLVQQIEESGVKILVILTGHSCISNARRYYEGFPDSIISELMILKQ